MFGAARRLISELKWRSFVRDLDVREAEARKRNATREIGQVRKERRDRIHRALGWRGTH